VQPLQLCSRGPAGTQPGKRSQAGRKEGKVQAGKTGTDAHLQQRMYVQVLHIFTHTQLQDQARRLETSWLLASNASAAEKTSLQLLLLPAEQTSLYLCRTCPCHLRPCCQLVQQHHAVSHAVAGGPGRYGGGHVRQAPPQHQAAAFAGSIQPHSRAWGRVTGQGTLSTLRERRTHRDLNSRTNCKHMRNAPHTERCGSQAAAAAAAAAGTFAPAEPLLVPAHLLLQGHPGKLQLPQVQAALQGKSNSSVAWDVAKAETQLHVRHSLRSACSIHESRSATVFQLRLCRMQRCRTEHTAFVASTNHAWRLNVSLTVDVLVDPQRDVFRRRQHVQLAQPTQAAEAGNNCSLHEHAG
jgi:hypothetical protein